MARLASAIVVALGGVLLSVALSGAPRNLEIYWIDAEGGAATLIVAPGGQSLLVDSANRTPDDRDASRILAAARLAGLTRIDMLLTTHFHGDHIGAMPALAAKIPIGMYLDHGESVEIARPQVAEAYRAYVELSAGKRRILKPGDRIPLAGVDIQVLISGGQAITKSLKGAGARNDCADFVAHPPDTDPDNDQSVGFLLTFGTFRFHRPRRSDLELRAEAGVSEQPDRDGRSLPDDASWSGPIELAADSAGAPAESRGDEQRPAQGRRAERVRDAATIGRAGGYLAGASRARPRHARSTPTSA